MCSPIYDACDQKPINICSLFHVFMFIISYSLKVIFFLFWKTAKILPFNCTANTDFHVKYWETMTFLQMSPGDLLEASFQLTAFEF